MRTDIFQYTDETSTTRYGDPTILLEDLYFFAELAGHDYPDLLHKASASKPALDDAGVQIMDEVPVMREVPVLDEYGKPKIDELGEVVTEPQQVLDADGTPLMRQVPRRVRDFTVSRDATQVLRGIVCQAFGVKPFDPQKPDEPGLKADAIDAILNGFYDMRERVKKNTVFLPTSSKPSDPSSSASAA